MNTKKKSRKFIRQNYNFNSQDIINDPKKSILIDAMNIANIRNNDNKAHLIDCPMCRNQKATQRHYVEECLISIRERE